MNLAGDEQLLEWFRQWVAKVRAEADRGETNAAVRMPLGLDSSGVGLCRLIEEFTALRQEIKIQARGARGLEENSEKLLTAMQDSIDALRSVEPRESQAAWMAGKGLALALADLDEALDRARVQLEKIRFQLDQGADELLLADLERLHAKQSWLQRWLTRDYHRSVCRRLKAPSTELQTSRLLEAVFDGYVLIQQRLARCMAAEQVVRIPTTGLAVDPEQMIVLAIVDSSAEPGTVVEEVRRGYLWNGRLLRCAEVRAARMDSVLAN